MVKKDKLGKRIFKKTGEELQEYLQFQRRGYKVAQKREKVLILENKNIKTIMNKRPVRRNG